MQSQDQMRLMGSPPDPMSEPLKEVVRKKSPLKKVVIFIFHLILISGSIAVIAWGLILGRVFVPPERDYEPAVSTWIPATAGEDTDE